MEITNDLVYEAASRMLDVWRRCKPNNFYDLASKTLGKDVNNVRFEPAYHDGRSTGLEMTYLHKGHRILTIIIPQLGVDKTKIKIYNNSYETKELNLPFKKIPVEIAKIKNDLEEKIVSREFLETSLPEMEIVPELA